MSNGAWLADLLNMRGKGTPDARILETLRDNHKRGDYPNLNAQWARDNIKLYGMEEKG